MRTIFVKDKAIDIIAEGRRAASCIRSQLHSTQSSTQSPTQSSTQDAISTHLIFAEDGERFFDLLIGETQEGIFRVEWRDLGFIGRCLRLFVVAHDDLRRRSAVR